MRNAKEPREDLRDQRERRTEEKKGKSYEKMRQEKRRLAESKKMAEGSLEVAKDEGKKDEGERCKKEAKIERTEASLSVFEVDGGAGGDCVDHKVQSKEAPPKNTGKTVVGEEIGEINGGSYQGYYKTSRLADKAISFILRGVLSWYLSGDRY